MFPLSAFCHWWHPGPSKTWQNASSPRFQTAHVVCIYIYNQNEKMTGSSKKTIKCMQIKSDCKQKRFFFYQQPFLGIVRIIHHRISTGWASQRLCSDHVQSWALLSKSCIQVPQVRPTRQRCIVVIQLTRLRSR